MPDHDPGTCVFCQAIRKQNPEAWRKWMAWLGIIERGGVGPRHA